MYKIRTLAEIEKEAIVEAVSHFVRAGKIPHQARVAAAKSLGVSSRTLYRKLQEYGLDGRGLKVYPQHGPRAMRTSAANVRKVKKLLAKGKNNTFIAEKLGVTWGTVRKIRSGEVKLSNLLRRSAGNPCERETE